MRQHFGTRFNHWVLQLELVDEPGSRFDYNNNETNLLGLVLERAVQQKYPEYLSEKIWQPLALGPARAYLDRPGGDAMKSCCILSRPIDWLKLGQLLLDDGIYAGKRILPPGWVAEMVTPAGTFPGYGYQVWLSPVTLRGGSIREQAPASPYLWWASEPFAGTVYGFTGFGFPPRLVFAGGGRRRRTRPQPGVARKTLGPGAHPQPAAAGNFTLTVSGLRKRLTG